MAAHPSDMLRWCVGTVLLLTNAGVQIEALVVASPPDDVWPSELGRQLGLSGVELLGLPSLQLESRAVSLRELLAERIRVTRPNVVIGVDPTPRLLQHPDHRVVARSTLDAAWPYAANDPATADPYQPSEAWLYSGPAPDLFVRIDADLRAELSMITGAEHSPEETFTQIDLRSRP